MAGTRKWKLIVFFAHEFWRLTMYHEDTGHSGNTAKSPSK